MKTIFSVVVLSLLSVSVLAAPAKSTRKPNSVTLTDYIFTCKNSQSPLTYVANSSTGELSTYEKDGSDSDTEPDRIRRMTNLKVEESKPKYRGNSREEITITFKKMIEATTRTFYRPVFEIEIQKDNSNSEVEYVEAKVMDVKSEGDNEFDVNMKCVSSKE